MKKTAKSKRTALVVLCVVLAFILVLLILGTAYMESVMGLINREQNSGSISESEYQEFLNEQTETIAPDFSGETLNPEDVIWDDPEQLVGDGKNIINILLIGQDRRPGEGRSRSDAMILCTVNKKAKTITMTSFMRDMYVQIPGYYDDRINVCYFLGGMELLDACLEKNFGVHVDGNIEVDFNGFTEVIDLVGGVDIELTSAEVNYLTKYGYSVTTGLNHLNGETALEYSRIRYIGDDFGRTQRQRTVLSAIVQKAKTMSLGQLNSLLKEILPMLTTDLSNAEILDYTLELFPLLPDLTIQTERIPVDGSYREAWIREMAVLVPDLKTNQDVLAEIMKE